MTRLNDGGFDLYACDKQGCLCEILTELPKAAAVRRLSSDGENEYLCVFRYRKNEAYLSWDFEFICANQTEASGLCRRVNDSLSSPMLTLAPPIFGKPPKGDTHEKRKDRSR